MCMAEQINSSTTLNHGNRDKFEHINRSRPRNICVFKIYESIDKTVEQESSEFFQCINKDIT